MIYVLIPARDEAPTVGLLLWKVRQAFTGFSREYQIIVVNDGSRDASDDVLAPYTRALPLTLLTHREPRGYAASLEELLRAAVQRTDRPRRDLAVTLQADFSESPEDLVELVKRLEAGADIAVPDRRERLFGTRVGRWAHRGLNALLRRRLGLPQVPDLVGTMRAYRLAVIERLIRQYGSKPFIHGDGWSADISLLARAGRHARTIESVTIESQRPSVARPSRARPLAKAVTAYRESASLLHELRAPLPPLQAVPRESAEGGREPVTVAENRREQPRARHDRPERQRAREPQRDRERERRPRRDRQREQQAPQSATAVAEAPVKHDPAGPEAGNDPSPPRRKRRRRGRGKGRGRRDNGNGPPPLEGGPAGDSSINPPSAA